MIRYIKSFNWKVEEAYSKLVNQENWRRENDCLEITEDQIQDELNMKVLNFYPTNKLIGIFRVWKR